jgi:hypothetical protein
LGAVIALLTAPAMSQTAWTPAPFFGTWSLLAAKSQYARDAVPAQMILVIEPASDGLEYRSETRYADGRTAAAHFVARLDETPAPVAGRSGFLAPVSLGPASDGGIDAAYRSGLKKIAWSHWQVSTDRTELTVTTTYRDAQGEELQNTVVFRRSDVR